MPSVFMQKLTLVSDIESEIGSVQVIDEGKRILSLVSAPATQYYRQKLIDMGHKDAIETAEIPSEKGGKIITISLYGKVLQCNFVFKKKESPGSYFPGQNGLKFVNSKTPIRQSIIVNEGEKYERLLSKHIDYYGVIYTPKTFKYHQGDIKEIGAVYLLISKEFVIDYLLKNKRTYMYLTPDVVANNLLENVIESIS